MNRRQKLAIHRLKELASGTVTCIRDGREEEVCVEQIVKGDRILIKPGDRIPLDGIVVAGKSFVDEFMLTGESIPVEKEAGSEIIGGSVNCNGTMEAEITRTGSATTLAKIIKLMEDAREKKAPISHMTDMIAGLLLPVVIVLAAIAAVGWTIGGKDILFVVQIFISVVAVGYPGALRLATPSAIMAGTRAAAEHGILIKSGEALEKLKFANVVILDKTGTVTEGKPKVTGIYSNTRSEEDILALAAACETISSHPFGGAIVKEARARGVVPRQGENVRTVMEKDIPKGMEELQTMADEIAEKGQTALGVMEGETVLGLISVADTVKRNSEEAISEIKKMGIQVYLLTGDKEKTARHIGQQVHADKVIAQVLPGDKAAIVERLQKENQWVLMVGDGINDAPALAQADVGIAIGGGSDIALESSDVVLLRSDLMDVSRAIKLSQSTVGVIKGNLFIAFIFHSVSIPIAAGILYLIGGPLLPPLLAVLTMALSVAAVAGNALRLGHLKLWKIKNKKN